MAVAALLSDNGGGIADGVDSWPEAIVTVAFFLLIGFVVWCMSRD